MLLCTLLYSCAYDGVLNSPAENESESGKNKNKTVVVW